MESPADTLLEKLFGFRLSQAISVAAALRIADLLSEGPRSVDELAEATDTHAPSLYRLLRALAAAEIFEELADRRFVQTSQSELLCANSPQSLHGWAAYIGRSYAWRGWGNLLHSVQTGESGLKHEVGMDVWAFRAQHPEETAIFDSAMTSHTRVLSPAVVSALDWSRFPTIADIAGGHGAQLADILIASPHSRGILFDQAHVVDGAASLLKSAGVADRCEVIAGSVFEAVPKADAYILKHILHDWYDDDCVRILRTIHAVAAADARLLVIERVVGPPNEDWATKSSDLNMLVAPGGMERTLDEFAHLLADGGWKLLRPHPAGTHHVIEASSADV